MPSKHTSVSQDMPIDTHISEMYVVGICFISFDVKRCVCNFVKTLAVSNCQLVICLALL